MNIKIVKSKNITEGKIFFTEEDGLLMKGEYRG